MAKRGWCYKVDGVGKGLRGSYPMREVRAGTTVCALEDAPHGSLDVIDVLLANGDVRSVYSFQLRKRTTCRTKSMERWY